MQREVICIQCPRGCLLNVEFDEVKILAVHGNRCRRGIGYAEEEIYHPTRTLTTTVRIRGGVYAVIPVKTIKPIPKERIGQAMQEISSLIVSAPIESGQVIIKDLVGLGIAVIATRRLTEAN